MKHLLKRGPILLACAALALGATSVGQAYTENFDSYATNSTIIGQGGWEGWDAAPAANSTVVAGGLSAPNRIRITGTSDTIHQYSGYTSGKWVYRAKQFVPATSVGDTYFILLNRYNHGGPYSWSVQLRCNAATHTIQNDRDSTTGPSLPLVTDEWKEIRCEIDIDANQVSIYYDNALLSTGTWKQATDTGAQNALACVDLYAAGPNSVAFYDDIRLDPGGPILAFGNYHTRLGGAVVETTGTGTDRRLPVRNLGSSGEDGVAIDLGLSGGGCLSLNPIAMAATEDGASMRVDLNGLPPGEPIIRVASVQFDKASPYIWTKCVAGRSYQNFMIECYLEDQLVATSPGGGGGEGPQLLKWPYWMEGRTAKECRPFHHRAIFVQPGDDHDQGDIWLGLGAMDVDGDGIQLVTLPSGASVLCNLIRFVPAPQPSLSKAIHVGYNVKANKKVSEFTVNGEMRYAFGYATMTLGDNTVAQTNMAGSTPSLTISNLGSTGQDGVEFHSCPGNGWDAVWDPLPVPPVDGATLAMEAMGILNGHHSRIGQTYVRFRPAFFDVFADFTDIGAGSMHAIGRLNGQVVFDQTGVPNGLIGSSSIWPRCGGKLGRPTPCFRWWWGAPFPFLRNGQNFLIDELLLLADGPPGTTLDDLDVLRFRTKDIPSMTFTDVSSNEYKRVEITPTLEGCPDPVGEMAHYQVRDADTGQVVQEGDAPVGSDLKIIIEVWYKGRCIIHIEVGRYLQKNTEPRVLENLNFFDVFMTVGDADGDNEVGIGDYALLSAAYGSSPGMPNWSPQCDFDCDEEIGIGDYALLSANYGMAGDE
ncbi:MAG: hypothetical protein K1X67_24730 [Fimbriimonadaceae bacterium]|nr:hypothetical protein [Fimbriimonadaceae bacterium]